MKLVLAFALGMSIMTMLIFGTLTLQAQSQVNRELFKWCVAGSRDACMELPK